MRTAPIITMCDRKQISYWNIDFCKANSFPHPSPYAAIGINPIPPLFEYFPKAAANASSFILGHLDHFSVEMLLNSLTPICVWAGTKNYPSIDFLRKNSTFFLVSATQPLPTNNTTMVSGFNTYTRSSANARWTSGWGRGWSKRFN
jgi:hypothetical protein